MKSSSGQDDFFAIDLEDREGSPRTAEARERSSDNGSVDRYPRDPGEVLGLDETVFEASSAEAEYQSESRIRCPSCREMIESVLAVRLSRSRVNFISTLPRRGYLVVCPSCRAVLPADLGGLLL